MSNKERDMYFKCNEFHAQGKIEDMHFKCKENKKFIQVQKNMTNNC